MISESATAETTAPPMPCTARAPMSTSASSAQPAGERRGREDRDPDQEQPPVAEEVAQPAAEEQESAEREQVGVHDPGQRGLREAEVGTDRRQRDVHDRRVEHDHQIAQAEGDEGEPAGAIGHAAGIGVSCSVGRHPPETCPPDEIHRPENR